MVQKYTRCFLPVRVVHLQPLDFFDGENKQFPTFVRA